MTASTVRSTVASKTVKNAKASRPTRMAMVTRTRAVRTKTELRWVTTVMTRTRSATRAIRKSATRKIGMKIVIRRHSGSSTPIRTATSMRCVATQMKRAI
jgi:hypothetical protein